MDHTLDFYTGLLLWASGFLAGLTVCCLIAIVAIKRAWVTIQEDQ